MKNILKDLTATQKTIGRNILCLTDMNLNNWKVKPKNTYVVTWLKPDNNAF